MGTKFISASLLGLRVLLGSDILLALVGVKGREDDGGVDSLEDARGGM